MMMMPVWYNFDIPTVSYHTNGGGLV